MLNPKAIERSFSRYEAYPDVSTKETLKVLKSLLLAAAAEQPGAPEFEVPPKDELVALLSRGDRVYLAEHPARVDRGVFLGIVRRLAAAAAEALSGEDAQKLLALDWEGLVTEETLARFLNASEDPSDAASRSFDGDESEDRLRGIVFLVLLYALRVVFEPIASALTKALDAADDPFTFFSRRLTCPVCGTRPDFTAVVPTRHTGNVKRCYCETCGAAWKFERIRCAACGTDKVSDLYYAHDEKDPSGRVHVCLACRAAVPTLFAAGEEFTFSPDIESWGLRGLSFALVKSQEVQA